MRIFTFVSEWNKSLGVRRIPKKRLNMDIFSRFLHLFFALKRKYFYMIRNLLKHFEWQRIRKGRNFQVVLIAKIFKIKSASLSLKLCWIVKWKFDFEILISELLCKTRVTSSALFFPVHWISPRQSQDKSSTSSKISFKSYSALSCSFITIWIAFNAILRLTFMRESTLYKSTSLLYRS